MTMSIKELQELMKLMNRHKLVEFNMKDGDFEIQLKSEGEPAAAAPAPLTTVLAAAPVAAAAAPAPPVAAQAPAAAPAPAAPAEAPAPAAPTQIAIKSPMPGTFYRSSSPDKPPFAKVGDDIAKGQVVCMIEAMKLFNELEAEVSGRIVKVLVEDKQPVEFDQVLFLVEPG